MSGFDAVDGSHPKASRCHNGGASDDPRMSLLGYKETSIRPKSTSALPPTPDVPVERTPLAGQFGYVSLDSVPGDDIGQMPLTGARAILRFPEAPPKLTTT